MKKYLLTATLVVTFFSLWASSAAAVENGVVKVGLRWGNTALFSANLENKVGEGYEFGCYDDSRTFVSLGETERTAISMTAAGTIYMDGSGNYSSAVPAGGYRTMGAWHVQTGEYSSFQEAVQSAAAVGGWPAWIDGTYAVRRGCYSTRAEAESAGGGTAVQSASDGVLVTATRTTEILFEFEGGGQRTLGVRPVGWGQETSTWFRGCLYPGGFEYPRAAGRALKVVNVVELEDYVKGVVPYEMPGNWPLAALEAQAVCARTYVMGHSGHLRSEGFDLCSGTDCQIYKGHGSGSAGPTDLSDQAVENTAGLCLYYQGALVQDPVYHASDGGATEDGASVWGTETGYLKGKLDPYEAQTQVPNNAYSVTYTAAELTWILEQKGYSVGAVQDVYVSQWTPRGNVQAVTFVGSGGTKTVTGETCRTVFYSSTYQKSVTSQRFSINGQQPEGSAVTAGGIATTSGSLVSLEGALAVSEGGFTPLEGDASAVAASGVTAITGEEAVSVPVPAAPSGGGNGTFVITGTGNGHNVGLSQYGAKAMAELGRGFREILNFYYTDITIG